MESGIYCIKNRINGKTYIGQSINLNKRKNIHYYYLNNNKHDNAHLQYAWNKYGENNFEFEILLYCEPFELIKYEQFFVNSYIPEMVYNIRLECVETNSGIKFSEEIREKLRKAHGGKNHHLYGKHHSEETKKRMSEAQKRNKSRLGRHISEETREKMSKSNKGRIPWNKGKTGIYTEEAIKKMRKPKKPRKSIKN